MTKISDTFHVVSFIVLFAISTLILLIGSISKTPISAWVGYLDVALVVLIVLTGFVIYQGNRNPPRHDISHQIALYLCPLIFVGMWLYRNHLDFNILLPGVAWQTYLFLRILPHAMMIWKVDQHS